MICYHTNQNGTMDHSSSLCNGILLTNTKHDRPRAVVLLTSRSSGDPTVGAHTIVYKCMQSTR